MDETRLAAAFEERRPRLRGVAYRILGSVAESEEVVQEGWLRLQAADVEAIEDLDAWLTTVVARLALRALRGRRRIADEPVDAFPLEPVVSVEPEGDPEQEALLADAVGVALQVVIDSLGPAERLAFVLHDMFAVPFDEIAAILDRSPAATRQLASRARRHVRDATPGPEPEPSRGREVVDAYFAAAREGDLDGLAATRWWSAAPSRCRVARLWPASSPRSPGPPWSTALPARSPTGTARRSRSSPSR
jgi:RNA polymerase sigma-70 factor (ECF subfamily)